MNNDEKLKLIYNKYRENKNSHVYLVETNSINDALNDIKKLIIKMNQNSDDNNIEKLIDTDSLPTLTIIWPDNQEIKKENIEELIVKIQKIPVITKENYFIICNAEKLNQKSGNIMLKTIEEPETDVLGFFICNNSNSVLSTIQSRTQYISLQYDKNETYDNDIINDAVNYFKSLHNSPIIDINKKYVDKYKDINIICNFLECLVNEERKFINSQNIFDIIKKEEQIIKLIYELESNIRKNGNISLLFDKFVIEVGRL